MGIGCFGFPILYIILRYLMTWHCSSSLYFDMKRLDYISGKDPKPKYSGEINAIRWTMQDSIGKSDIGKNGYKIPDKFIKEFHGVYRDKIDEGMSSNDAIDWMQENSDILKRVQSDAIKYHLDYYADELGNIVREENE